MEKIKISLLSDTHGFLDQNILDHLKNSDEIWHAGDVGENDVLSKMQSAAKTRAVYGNIDGGKTRQELEEELIFEIEGLIVYIIHIGGYPPKYTGRIKKRLDEIKPDLFICGHSHILKVIRDNERDLLHINPGAAGQHGFHKIRTMIQFSISNGTLSDMQVIELGKRGQ